MRLNPDSLSVESFATDDAEKVGAASSMTYSDCSCVCIAPTCQNALC